MPSIRDRLSHAWNAFANTNRYLPPADLGYGNTYRPDRKTMSPFNEKTIITALFNRIAIDVASIDMYEAMVNDSGSPLKRVDSGLTYCLETESNIDQTGRDLMMDIVLSMFDEGTVAVVPYETDLDPRNTNSYDIKKMRTAQVVEWYPKYVKVRLYNEDKGRKEDIILPKRSVAIIENPLYAVVNEPNSTLKRLVHKLNLLDSVDEQASAGKLDLIIQLPYTIKSESRKQQAENRRKEIEMQLKDSTYGIAYTDGTEKVTQLNRSIENNMLETVKYLQTTLYSQLGVTEEVFNGTADETKMLYYYRRTIEPICEAIVKEFNRKFLTKTARTQGHCVVYIRNPFKLVPINNLAELADKFTRNEILTSNEVRSIIGFAPSDDPNADVLRNKNLNQSMYGMMNQGMMTDQVDENGNPIQTDENGNPIDENGNPIQTDENGNPIEEQYVPE